MKPNSDYGVEVSHKNITILSKEPRIILTQYQNTLAITCLCSWQLLAAARAERYRCRVYHFSLTSTGPCVAFLTACMSARLHACNFVLVWQSAVVAHQSSVQSSWVCLQHLALIFNRADSPLLDWKPFTNMFCTSSLTLTDLIKHFSSHVNSTFVNKFPRKTNFHGKYCKQTKTWKVNGR